MELIDDEISLVGKPTMWFPNRSDTNRAVQAQKRARSLTLADLRLCFRLCRLLVFPQGGSNVQLNNIYSKLNTPGPLYNMLRYNTISCITLITVGPQL